MSAPALTAPLHHQLGLTLPLWRGWLLGAATLLGMGVYYLNYGSSFDEGDIQSGSPLTLPARIVAVVAIVAALSPLRMRAASVWTAIVIYLLSGTSMMVAAGIDGRLNDSLFVNTLLQLPVLVALTSSTWQLDHARCLRVLCSVLAVQIIGDTAIWLSDASLWLSAAFVGGVGNPSSFGLFCAIGCAFSLLHPGRGRLSWVFGVLLAFGAVMSQALFAAIAVGATALIWMALDWRRLLLGPLYVGIGGLAALTWFAGTGADQEMGFLEHKINAAAAIFGLVEYDVESSASVSQRVVMHRLTLDALESSPPALVWGHLQGLPYWPMDSQLLTYLGSFGAPMLALFVALHLYWQHRAWQLRQSDGGFTFVAMVLFALIFATNRILDYFPVASLYFLLVAMCLLAPPRRAVSVPANLPRSGPRSSRSSGRAHRPAAP